MGEHTQPSSTPQLTSNNPSTSTNSNMNQITNAPSLITVPSLYIDSENNLPSQEDNTPIQDSNQSNSNSNDTNIPNSRKQARIDRAQRLAAETAAWVRTKFSLQPNEMLYASFSAALVRHILIQGRIHITTSSLCFYAKIFGRITKESWPFTTIARVKKRRGVTFVANAIKIYFLDDTLPPVVIASLNHRERAFGLIQDRLRELNPNAAEPLDDDDDASGASITSGHACSEDPSIDDDDFQHQPQPLPDAHVTPLGEISQNTHLSGQSSKNRTPSELGIESVRSSGRPPHPRNRSRQRDVNRKSQESDSSDMSSRRSSDVDHGINPVNNNNTNTNDIPNSNQLIWRTVDDHVDQLSAKAYHNRTERARTTLNAPCKEVFNILFANEWLRTYHDAANNKDIAFTEWQRDKQGYMTRTVTFRKPLGYKIGPKETRVKEVQRYSFTSEGGVVIEMEGHNLDAPYGDYFTCESFFELSPIEDGSSSLLVASIAVHFSKNTMLKGRIEAGALAETEIAYQKAVDLANAKIKEHKQQQQRATSKSSAKNTASNTADTSSGRPRKESIAPEQPTTTDIADQRADTTSEGSVPMSTSVGNTSPSNSGVIKVEETMTTQWLRIAAIGSLMFVCILLVTVLIMLNRMRHEVSALEQLISAHQLNSAQQCTQETCAAFASSSGS